MRTPQQTLPPLTPLRQYRLERRVRLSDAACISGVPLVRASMVERDIARARPGEVERLMAAMETIAGGRTEP